MSSLPPLFTTRRLSLRGLGEWDAEFMVRLVNSPGWLEFIGDRQVANQDDAVRFLQNGFLQSEKEHGFGYYVAQDQTHRPIGIVGFLKKEYLEYPDLGFAVLPDFVGQGFATEMAQGAIGYGRDRFGLDVLDAVTLPKNTASQAVLEKLQFADIGSCQTPAGESLVLYRWSLD